VYEGRKRIDATAVISYQQGR